MGMFLFHLIQLGRHQSNSLTGYVYENAEMRRFEYYLIGSNVKCKYQRPSKLSDVAGKAHKISIMGKLNQDSANFACLFPQSSCSTALHNKNPTNDPSSGVNKTAYRLLVPSNVCKLVHIGRLTGYFSLGG